MRILRRLAEDWPHPVLPGVLTRELALNRSTCYNIVATLRKSGWVTSLGAREGWTLGPQLLTLISRADNLFAVAVQREIDDLSRRLGFVVFVAEPDSSGGYVAVAKAEQPRGVRVTVGLGDGFPFSAPALMQAFGAWLPRPEFDERVNRYGLIAFTQRSVIDLARLHEQLERVRRLGYSSSLQEYDMAQAGVAAPIFDRAGRVGRVICSLAFCSDLHEGNVAEIGVLVRDCAERITAYIGGRHPEAAENGLRD